MVIRGKCPLAPLGRRLLHVAALRDRPDHRPRPLDRERRGQPDLLGGAQRGRPELAGRHHLVHQAQRQRLVGLHRPAGQEQAPRPRRPERGHEAAQPVRRVDHPQPGRRHRQARALAGDAEVARHGELERPAHHGPVHDADHRAPAAGDGAGRLAQQALAVAHPRGELVGGAVGQVQAGREVALAGPGQQDGPRLGDGRPLQLARQGGQDAGVERVRPGLVGDPQHAGAGLVVRLEAAGLGGGPGCHR